MTQIDTKYEDMLESKSSDYHDWYKNHVLSEDERKELIRRKMKLLELYRFRSENRFYDD
jgi:hypothetical protein